MRNLISNRIGTFLTSILLILTVDTSYSKIENEVLSRVPGLLIIKDDLGSVSDLVVDDIRSMGYSINEIFPDLITPEIVESHDLTILCTGTNPNPCSNSFMRNILISHANSGGKILIEGGENGYVSAVFPGYAAFLNKVLKASAWLSNTGGNFEINPKYLNSTIANIPNPLPANLNVLSGSNYLQDVCPKMETSLLLYKCQLSQNSAGVLVFPFIDQVQIINMSFSYNAIDRSSAKNLMANFLNSLVGSPIGINVTNSEIPENFDLKCNYPNPFNSTTVIRFSLPRSLQATLRIYSTEGKLVGELINDRYDAGNYEIILDASSYSSGIYFVVLQADEFMDVVRITLVK
jgi:hypothetical protein